MNKVTIIGSGAWGSTLAEVLSDNNYQVLMYDINQNFIDLINQNIHPQFNLKISQNIKGTTKIEEALDFSNYIVLAVPSKAIRNVLKSINHILKDEKVFIDVSKGIEVETFKRISEIVKEEISDKFLKGYVCLTGPSHAEEVILKKLTLLTAASDNLELAIKVQEMFANYQYLRVYTSNDVIGSEIGGSMKNAIAVISGAATGIGLGENARAALITRGIVEMVRVIEILGGNKETAYGLSGIGDLIVTASSEKSRNFKAGYRLGQGDSLDTIYQEEKQTIEGVRSIEAFYHFSKRNNIELPLIDIAFDILFNNCKIEDGVKKLLKRELKPEII